MKTLQYTIQEKELKGMGYIFQKLYAADYKTYRLEVEKWSYTIWLWVSGKSIEVNDWYSFTHKVLEFYKANRDSEKFLNKDYIKIALNRETGDIILNTRYDEIDEIFNMADKSNIKELSNALIAKYDNLHEIFINKEKMDKVISEIEKLNPIVV